jgi:uncharacterized protein (DUF697 family)
MSDTTPNSGTSIETRRGPTAQDHARSLVHKYAVGAGAGSLLPLPGLWAAVTAAEAMLIKDIALAYGENLSRGDIAKLAALAGAKNIGVRVLADMALMFPAIGTLARVALLGGGVKGFGEVLIRHFEEKHPGALKAA